MSKRKRLRGAYALRCAVVELAPHEHVPCLTVRLMLMSAETGEDTTALLALTCADGVALAAALVNVATEYAELAQLAADIDDGR